MFFGEDFPILEAGGVLLRAALGAVARLFVERVQAVRIVAGELGVRRRYRRTVLRAAKEPPQPWMSPAEAEAHAKLSGDDADRPGRSRRRLFSRTVS